MKAITPTGKMSNLVNMWAFVWEGDVLKKQYFVLGKADDQHYIIQAINSMTGETNVCKIVELKDMMDWIFYPTKEIVNMVIADYAKTGVNRYKI